MTLDRRSFLKTAGYGAGAAALGATFPAAATLANAPSRYQTRRVVMIAFAGGVRTRETLGTPANVPNLLRIAGRGAVCPNVQAENVGHYGAALSLFTGRTEVFGIRENAPSTNPTIFEYFRKQLGLPANGVWLSTTGGNQQVNFAHGTHGRYGAAYGANLIAPDGVFNAEFKEIVEEFGTPQVPSGAEAELTDRLRGMLGAGAGRGGQSAGAELRHVEEFVLNEIAGKNVELTGPGAADAKALRVATSILQVFRPTLLGVTLNQHDVAHGSFNAYVEIIRRNDAELGRLFDAVQRDPELADTTAIVVVPEFGRDRDLNERNGLDHGDGSEELGRVALVACGPDFPTGRTLNGAIRTYDVCPTVCRLFGVDAEYAKGRVIPGLLV